MPTTMTNILLVEDELDIAELTSDWLERHHHCVDIATSGEDAITAITSNPDKYSMLILDVMLPRKTGTEVCEWFRINNRKTPILMLTAKDAIDDKEKAFKSGADDYLTKPFHLRELTMRVEALLRRSSGAEEEVGPVSFGDYFLDPASYTVTHAGKRIRLSPTEFRLLDVLARNPKRTFSADDLLKRAWEPGSDAMSETVRGHINRLRRKLDVPGKPSIIRSAYGFGYTLGLDE